jgi:hypothetical protein
MKKTLLTIITLLVVSHAYPQNHRHKGKHQNHKQEQEVYQNITPKKTYAGNDSTTTHQKLFLRKNVLLFSGGIGEDHALCDMGKRFGFNTNADFAFHYYTHKGLMVGLEFNYIFGRDLKGDALHIFDNIKTQNGQIINMYGQYSQYYVAERGFFTGIKAGYTFKFTKQKKHKILTTISAVFLQHKLFISVDGNNTPQIQGEYAKGYDRLTNGFGGKFFLGYAYLPVYSPFNFYAGIEFYYAQTKNRRAINFDTMQAETGIRNDCLIGLKAGWFISIYKQDVKKYYYIY